MIKDIKITQNTIKIVEETKGLFKVKIEEISIDLSTIDKIEKFMKDNELIGFAMWSKNEVIHAIGIKNYEDNIEKLLNQILENMDKNSVEIFESIV